MEDQLHIIINKRVRDCLATLGKNQEWLAAEADIDKSQLSQILNIKDNKRWDNQKLERTAKAFGIPAWHLLTDPKLTLDEFDRELASRFRDAPEDVQTTIKRLLGMMDMPYTQPEAGASASIHDGGKPAKGDFKMPKLPKGKKK